MRGGAVQDITENEKQEILDKEKEIQRLKEEYLKEEEKKEQLRNAVVGNYLKTRMGVNALLDKRILPNGKYARNRKSIFEVAKPSNNNNTGCGSVVGYELAERREFECDVSFYGDILSENQQVTIPFSACKFGNPRDKEIFCNEKEEVTLYNVTCTRYENASDYHLTAALSIKYDHPAYATAPTDVQDAVEAVGGLRHSSFDFKPNKGEKRKQTALKVQSIDNQRYHFGNPDFISSTRHANGDADAAGVYGEKTEEEMCLTEKVRLKQHLSGENVLVDSDNMLWEGVIKIPKEVCVEAGLNIYNEESAISAFLKQREAHQKLVQKGNEELKKFGESSSDEMDISDDEDVLDKFSKMGISQEEKESSDLLNANDDLKRRCWYAIDMEHVLAWSLKTSAMQLRSVGIDSFQIHVTTMNKVTNAKDVVPFCHIVSDVSLRGLIRLYNISWANRVSVKPATQVGFILAPLNRNKDIKIKDVKLTFRILGNYILWKPPNDKLILPKLHPLFTPFKSFVISPFHQLSQGSRDIPQ
jgi:hypothetical protein